MLALEMAPAPPESRPVAQAAAEFAPPDELEALRPVVRAAIAALLRQGRNDPDVEDCTHETFRRAIEGRERLQPGLPLRPWVVGIARHVALDALRARRRESARLATNREPLDDGALVERVPDSTPGADVAMEKAQTAARVRAALHTLSDDQRRVLEMFHLQGLAYREIADRLGVPMGTVCTWVARGRRAVARALEDGDQG